jgi:hypothetical protein
MLGSVKKARSGKESPIKQVNSKKETTAPKQKKVEKKEKLSVTSDMQSTIIHTNKKKKQKKMPTVEDLTKDGDDSSGSDGDKVKLIDLLSLPQDKYKALNFDDREKTRKSSEEEIRSAKSDKKKGLSTKVKGDKNKSLPEKRKNDDNANYTIPKKKKNNKEESAELLINFNKKVMSEHSTGNVNMIPKVKAKPMMMDDLHKKSDYTASTSDRRKQKIDVSKIMAEQVMKIGSDNPIIDIHDDDDLINNNRGTELDMTVARIVETFEKRSDEKINQVQEIASRCAKRAIFDEDEDKILRKNNHDNSDDLLRSDKPPTIIHIINNDQEYDNKNQDNERQQLHVTSTTENLEVKWYKELEEFKKISMNPNNPVAIKNFLEMTEWKAKRKNMTDEERENAPFLLPLNLAKMEDKAKDVVEGKADIEQNDTPTKSVADEITTEVTNDTKTALQTDHTSTADLSNKIDNTVQEVSTDSQMKQTYQEVRTEAHRRWEEEHEKSVEQLNLKQKEIGEAHIKLINEMLSETAKIEIGIEKAALAPIIAKMQSDNTGVIIGSMVADLAPQNEETRAESRREWEDDIATRVELNKLREQEIKNAEDEKNKVGSLDSDLAQQTSEIDKDVASNEKVEASAVAEAVGGDDHATTPALSKKKIGQKELESLAYGNDADKLKGAVDTSVRATRNKNSNDAKSCK